MPYSLDICLVCNRLCMSIRTLHIETLHQELIPSEKDNSNDVYYSKYFKCIKKIELDMYEDTGYRSCCF
jgi:hypothetical protein